MNSLFSLSEVPKARSPKSWGAALRLAALGFVLTLGLIRVCNPYLFMQHQERAMKQAGVGAMAVLGLGVIARSVKRPWKG
jgi:hypothetical protein